MAQYVYFKGILKWCRPTQADKFLKYSTVLYPDNESVELFRKLQESDGKMSGIMNKLQKDDEGYFIRLGRPVEIEVQGKKIGLGPVEVLDGSKPFADGSGWAPLRDTGIGNGSSGVCKCELRTFPNRFTGGKSRSIRLASIRIDHLVPYQNRDDFTPDENKLVDGMEKQSKEQLW